VRLNKPYKKFISYFLMNQFDDIRMKIHVVETESAFVLLFACQLSTFLLALYIGNICIKIAIAK
jgi:hypothetical protein